MRRDVAVLVLLLALAAACARHSTPEDVVRRYFESLGSDPIRCASLMSGDFQRGNGLRLSTTAQGADFERRLRAGATAPAQAPPPSSAAVTSRAEAEVLWLATQIKSGFRERAERLMILPVDVKQEPETAQVAVRVVAPGAPPFLQRFFLVRGDDHRWLIDRVEQEGVDDRNLADAFVAAPSEVLRRRLAAALGLPAD